MADKTPNILLIDIESSPIVGYAWQSFDTNLLKIIEPTKVISVAWKQLHEKNVTVKCLADYKSYKKGQLDDKELIKEVWEVLDKADIVIGHNSDSFDIKKLNSRFLVHGLSAPSAYESIDTLKSSKKYFKFDSNSLNNLGIILGEGEKLANSGFGLWVKCMAGDPKAWELMKKYNAQDVNLLEKVYLRIRPYIDNHPNLALVSGAGSTVCPSCLSKSLSKRGFSFTKTGRKQRYQCSSCGSWSVGAFERVSK